MTISRAVVVPLVSGGRARAVDLSDADGWMDEWTGWGMVAPGSVRVGGIAAWWAEAPQYASGQYPDRWKP
jgi:hypothetical protein